MAKYLFKASPNLEHSAAFLYPYELYTDRMEIAEGPKEL
jgi:hypothetical protein